jgi:HPt (histidine-containing phosphotransfer) domain-containing protein
MPRTLESRVPSQCALVSAIAPQVDDDSASGMEGCVSKPVHQGELLRRRQALLDVVKGEEEAEQPLPMDFVTALERVDGDRAFLREMATLFLDESPALMAEIRVALAADEAGSLLAPAHKLKNWAGNFVAAPTLARLKRLEAFGLADKGAEAMACFSDLEREFDRLSYALAHFDPGPVPPPDGNGALLPIAKDYRSPQCIP